MNSRFFLRLALTNLRKNARMFVPYLLTCILSVSMYYVICSLAANPDLMNMFGGVQSRRCWDLGPMSSRCLYHLSFRRAF
ncbi:MAG: hypothetical protein ACLVJ6_05915 [Merdibacter sp.]